MRRRVLWSKRDLAPSTRLFDLCAPEHASKEAYHVYCDNSPRRVRPVVGVRYEVSSRDGILHVDYA
jgi:hypothetical protein